MNSSLLDLSIRGLKDYTISESHGFLPSEAPLNELTGDHSIYENLIRDPPLHEAIQSLELRRKVDEMRELEVHSLSLREKQRVYSILSFVVHGYIWGYGNELRSRIPSQLSRPLECVAKEFGLRPIGSYLSTVLWNCWSEERPSEWDPINIHVSLTFTGLEDERAFYAINASIEAHGAKSIRSIQHILRTPPNDVKALLPYFKDINSSLQKMLENIQLINAERIDNFKFYWKTRPYFAGWDTIPSGVHYQNCGDTEIENRRYSGISVAQSPCIQVLDHFFGYRHEGSRANYLRDMRLYMLSGHREYIEDLEGLLVDRKESLRMVFTHEGIYPWVEKCRKVMQDFKKQHVYIAKQYTVEQAAQGGNAFASENSEANRLIFEARAKDMHAMLDSFIRSTEPTKRGARLINEAD